MEDQTNTKNVVIKKDPPHATKEAFSLSKFGESYISLLLGAIVVIVAAVLGFFYVKSQQPKQELLPPAVISQRLTITPAPLSSSPSTTISPKMTITTTQKKEKVVAQMTNTKPAITKVITSKKIISKENKIQNKLNTQKNNESKYIVQKGDSLWSIAEKEYGDGYKWVLLAKANNLENPGTIFSKDTLIVPSLTSAPALGSDDQDKYATNSVQKTVITPTIAPQNGTIAQSNISGKSYIVQKGDNLWDISIKAYGNGYRWVDIAKVNNLSNPRIIHSGNTLQIPR